MEKDIRLKALSIVSFLIFILTFTFYLLQNNIIQKYIAQAETQQHNMIHSVRDKTMQHLIKRFVKRFKTMLSDEKVLNALETKDRKKFAKLIKPQYQYVKKVVKDLKAITIILPDNSTFIKIYEPLIVSYKNEEINNLLILKANKEKKMIVGYASEENGYYLKIINPIFNKKNKYLGLVELSFDINQIVKSVEEMLGESMALLVEKKALHKNYKAKANIKIGNKYYHLVYATKGDLVKNIVNNKDFKLENDLVIKNKDRLYVSYLTYLIDLNGDSIIANFQDITEISKLHEKNMYFQHIAILIVLILILLILYFSFGKLIYKIQKKELRLKKAIKRLQYQKRKIDVILNAQPSITILTDGKNIKDINKSFLKFFSQYDTLEAFKKEHDCICDFFEPYKDNNYIHEKIINGVKWVDFILQSTDISYKTVMKKDNKLYHFLIKANKIENLANKKFIVVSFVDITNELKATNDLIEKEQMLFHQSRLAQMGEMIGNIAHQWRQPLSVISTSASGIKIQKEFGTLSDELLAESIDGIMQSTQHLSQTIDDFRDFFKPNKTKTFFNLKDTFKRTVALLSSKFKNREIMIIKDIEDVEIFGLENELVQVIMNILNNSKDVLEELKSDKKRLIFVDIYKNEENAVIKIKDNGGGIPTEIIGKIFEPYFTTKEQSEGTGIGLYMTYEILVKHLNGSIKAENIEYNHNDEIYKCAQFTITLPLTKVPENIEYNP